MALPTITSVASPFSTNGGPAAGGYTATITGTNLTGTTSVKFGTNEATNINVVSATEVKCTVPANTVPFRGEPVGGWVAVTASAAGGTNVAEAGDIYAFWPKQKVEGSEGRQYETLPIGRVKGAGGEEPVSYLKAAGAENFTFQLYGDYAGQFADNIELEVNGLEATGTPKLKVLIEASIDGGVSWNPVPGLAESAEVNGVAKVVVEGASKEKPFGPYLRAVCKFGAAGGVAGTITLVTDHA